MLTEVENLDSLDKALDKVDALDSELDALVEVLLRNWKELPRPVKNFLTLNYGNRCPDVN